MRLPNIVLDTLVNDHSLGALEKALYLLAWARDPATITDLAKIANVDRGIASGACRNLVKHGLMRIIAMGRGRRPAAVIPHSCQVTMAYELEVEYDLVVNKGEFLTNKRLDWYLLNDEYVRNARPEFLKHPETGERLEYDRYDPKAAFASEFNGTQHYRASQKFSDDKVRQQQANDLVKESLSVHSGVTLVTFTSEDLRHGVLESKIDKVVPHLKRGYVDRDGPYMKTLNRICDNYASKAERREQPLGTDGAQQQR